MQGYSVVICDSEYLNNYGGNGIRLENVTRLELDALIAMVTRNEEARIIIIDSYEVDQKVL